jgi:uncharacterized membrane protein HdeD (DUF308 family)
MAERMSQSAINAGIADTRQRARDAVAEVEGQIAEHWVWYLILGIVLLLGGIAAIAFPFVSTMAAKRVLGWIFLFAGVFTIVHAFSAGNWRGFFWNLLIGILYTVGGAYLVFLPLAGVLTLTMLVAAIFLADGILEIIMAFRLRPHSGWGWVLASGVAALIAGFLIWSQLPSSATWVIGVLVGIKMIMAGSSFVALALGSHRDYPSTSLRMR